MVVSYFKMKQSEGKVNIYKMRLTINRLQSHLSTFKNYYSEYAPEE